MNASQITRSFLHSIATRDSTPTTIKGGISIKVKSIDQAPSPEKKTVSPARVHREPMTQSQYQVQVRTKYVGQAPSVIKSRNALNKTTDSQALRSKKSNKSREPRQIRLPSMAKCLQFKILP